MDPEEILKTAARLGFIADQRLKECRDLMERESIPADEALTRVSRLTRDQLRGVLVLSRYDRARHQDVALAEFIVRNGFLPRSIVETCLSEQEIPYQQGESIPRLQDMLLERNHLNGQQLQMILRARVQLEATRLQLVASGASGPATPPGAGPAMAASSAPSPASETRRRARVSQEDTADTFSMSLRRTRVRDARGDVPIFVLDLAGPLNPAASRRLGDYI
ncbi:MAG: hypothetical protein HYY16_09915, partial [Planctomycetes bacterium]|nr:hypothetical protein [Planctomycetota bacterium]